MSLKKQNQEQEQEYATVEEAQAAFDAVPGYVEQRYLADPYLFPQAEQTSYIVEVEIVDRPYAERFDRAITWTANPFRADGPAIPM